ncbi:MAG: hypothetical protein P8M80_17550 [Pirellulaceae bacterium]|nr:hypothetical protein [Pirellulaceae bacterium]
MSTDEFENEIDRELEQMSSAAADFISTCQSKSCYDGFGALRDRAEKDGRALFYIHGTFFQMTQASNLLEFHTTKERAIKLISIFQKPEECFKIQPDMPEDLLDYLIYDLSSCVYENLADAAGQMQGFNSRGLHDSISGGIQVCRNTGKVGCIQCFREYAGDVYLAADDLDLAKHQCQTVVEHQGEWQGRGNRRWLAMMKLGWISAMQGNLEDAQLKLEAALDLTTEKEVNVPIHAQFDVLCQLDGVRISRGLEPLLQNHEIFPKLPSKSESPLFDLMRSQNVALYAAAKNNLDVADEILSHWDRRLSSLQALHFWFENRLRLIVVKRLSAKTNSAESLAKTLEEKATSADDWLTLRRLNEIMGSTEDPVLIAAPNQINNVAKPVTGPIKVDPESTQSPFGDEEPVLLEQLDSIMSRMKEAYESQSSELVSSIVKELMAITPKQASTNADTCGVLNMMSMMIQPTLATRSIRIWRWANQLAAPFRENGVVLSLLATIGNELRLISDDPEEGDITPARIEQLFRQSLALEKKGPQTYARAGTFFLERNEIGDAEKCFARSFRLDRQNGLTALKLAEVYNMTDRPRDAMHVLDLCLREGSEYERVAWEAAMNAFGLRQFEPMLNYLNRYQELAGEQSPINYYRSIAYLQLGQLEKALEATEKENQSNQTGRFHCNVVEFCVLAKQQRHHNRMELATSSLQQKLSKLDYIPVPDIAYLLEILWNTLEELDVEKDLIRNLEDKMLASGLMPDDFFDKERAATPPLENVRFFRVLLEQKLDGHWADSDGCLPGQENWQSYYCEWGVVSMSEEDAKHRAIQYQSRCHPKFAEFSDISEEDHLFTDSPGVVWQGLRYAIPDDFGYYPDGPDRYLSNELDDDELDEDQPKDDEFDDDSNDDKDDNYPTGDY